MDEHCPRAIALSTLIDGESSGAARARLEAHVAGCPECGALLADLRALRADLRRLPDEALGVDLSEVIRGRLAAMPRRAAPRPRRGWRGWRDLLPIGIGATAAVSLGLSMGLALTAGSGAALAPRVAAMAVFDPVAPGGLCIGADACYAPRGANRGRLP